MQRKSTFSKTIDITQKFKEYDSGAKRLLSEKVILAWILKSCTSEFSEFSISKIMNECIDDGVQISSVPVDRDDEQITSKQEGDSQAESFDNSLSRYDGQLDGMNTEDNSVSEGNIY